MKCQFGKQAQKIINETTHVCGDRGTGNGLTKSKTMFLNMEDIDHIRKVHKMLEYSTMPTCHNMEHANSNWIWDYIPHEIQVGTKISNDPM